MDSPFSTFSPERCAALHNQLLVKATEHDPDVQIEQTLAARFLDIAPEFGGIPSLNDLPWYRFLCLLDTTLLDANGGVSLLTPFLYQPDPSTFWTDRIGHEPSFVLLYGRNSWSRPSIAFFRVWSSACRLENRGLPRSSATGRPLLKMAHGR
ncbi:hypothetical protein F4823DRAFT_599082 [Ustulina deusta]|nr:hypothetical protein F4823DRAFT_599082 [Ustulina deusta]